MTMDTQGLAITLTSLAAAQRDLQQQADADLADIQQTSQALDDIEARLAALGLAVPSVQPEPAARPTLPAILRADDWGAVRRAAEANLRERGLEPAQVSLEALLDPAEARRLERRFSGGFQISASLDRYDLAAAAVAALVAGAVDFFIVRIPADIDYLGKFAQAGSPLTKWLQSLTVPADNWLARYFKTAYDSVQAGIGVVEGFGPRTHRFQTFGHDPLVGLIIGTIDIMRGGMTAISSGGQIISLAGTGTAHFNPFTAFVWQIMHLLSDGFTKMGLPVPGWSLMQLFQVGSFGEKERTIAELARFMYLKGYDFRHFLTMSTSVAAVEVVLRGYFAVRQKLDPDYAAEVEQAGQAAGAHGMGDHPRFQAIALGAHMAAAAINAGKVAVYQGNPLAINYAQWLRFFHAAFAFAKTKLRSPSSVLMGRAAANWRALEAGWPVVDVAAPDFPAL